MTVSECGGVDGSDSRYACVFTNSWRRGERGIPPLGLFSVFPFHRPHRNHQWSPMPLHQPCSRASHPHFSSSYVSPLYSAFSCLTTSLTILICLPSPPTMLTCLISFPRLLSLGFVARSNGAPPSRLSSRIHKHSRRDRHRHVRPFEDDEGSIIADPPVPPKVCFRP